MYSHDTVKYCSTSADRSIYPFLYLIMPLFSENVEVLVEGERYVLVVREKGKTSFLSLEKNERWRYLNSILWLKIFK